MVRLARGHRRDLDNVVATIQRLAYDKSFLVNIGDEKGSCSAKPSDGPIHGSFSRAGHLLRLRPPAVARAALSAMGALGGVIRRRQHPRLPSMTRLTTRVSEGVCVRGGVTLQLMR